MIFYEKEYHRLLKTARQYRREVKTALTEKLNWRKVKKDQDELSIEVDRLDQELAADNTKVEELGATVRSMEKHHLKEVMS
jgi:hypothetical protein